MCVSRFECVLFFICCFFSNLLDGSFLKDGPEGSCHVGHGRGELRSGASFARARKIRRHRIASDERAQHPVDGEDGPFALPVARRVCTAAVSRSGFRVVVGVLLSDFKQSTVSNQLVEDG